MEKQYAERDAMALDDDGSYYIRHVCAMTKEYLHSKADIAAELAYRDMIIDRQKKRINQLLEQRNSTGVAIDNAMRGMLPDEHPLLSRLQMIANVSVNRNDPIPGVDALLKFYSVDSVASLVQAQEDHILRLQDSVARKSINQVLASSPVRSA